MSQRVERLELDIDTRLTDLWREASEREARDEGWNLNLLAVFMRAAYAKGYSDSLSETVQGSLMAEHGYKVPERKAAA